MDMHNLNKHLTVTVIIHVTREWNIRMAIAKMLIRTAALVLGCNIEIEEDQMKVKL
jgi:hypothetical protein